MVCAHPTPVSAAGQRCTEQRGRAGPKGNQLLFTPPTSKVATPFVFFFGGGTFEGHKQKSFEGLHGKHLPGNVFSIRPPEQTPGLTFAQLSIRLITYVWFVPTPPLSAQQDSPALSRGDALALRATSFCSHIYIYIVYMYVYIYIYIDKIE